MRLVTNADPYPGRVKHIVPTHMPSWTACGELLTKAKPAADERLCSHCLSSAHDYHQFYDDNVGP